MGRDLGRIGDEPAARTPKDSIQRLGLPVELALTNVSLHVPSPFVACPEVARGRLQTAIAPAEATMSGAAARFSIAVPTDFNRMISSAPPPLFVQWPALMPGGRAAESSSHRAPLNLESA